MSITRVAGIDPGLVHTGVVHMTFNPKTHSVLVNHRVVAGPDVNTVLNWAGNPHHVFIEAYRPRSHFGTDADMVDAVRGFSRAWKVAKVIDNTGVKKVVRSDLMRLLGVWKFSTPTHHQDLRSAAYILLYGMLKDEALNALLALIVKNHLDGRTWNVEIY